MITRWSNYPSLLAVLIVIFLFGCAASGRKKSAESANASQNGVPQQVEDLDVVPQPVGGLQAVIAAIDYPEDALKKNWEGVVMVAVLVDAAGRVNETRIAKSSGHAELDDEALIAVARVRWQAGRKDGKPVTTWTTVPVEFRVE